MPPSPSDLAAAALIATSSPPQYKGLESHVLVPQNERVRDVKNSDKGSHLHEHFDASGENFAAHIVDGVADWVGSVNNGQSPNTLPNLRSFTPTGSKECQKRNKIHNEYNDLARKTVASEGTITCVFASSVQTTYELSRDQSQKQERQYLAELGDAVPSWLRYHEDEGARSKLKEVAKAEAQGLVDVHRMLYLYRKVVMGLDDKDRGRLRSTAGHSLSVEILQMREPRLQFSIIHALNLAPTPKGGTTAGVIVPGSNTSRTAAEDRPPHLCYIGSGDISIKASNNNSDIKPYAVIWLNEFKEASGEEDDESTVIVDEEEEGKASVDRPKGTRKASKRPKKLRKLTKEELAERARVRALEKTSTKPFYKTKIATIQASVVANKGKTNMTSVESPYGHISGSPSAGNSACAYPIFNESTFSIDLRGIKARALHHLYRHTRLLRGLRKYKSTEVTAAAERAQAAFDDALKATKLRALPSLHIELWDGNERNKDKKTGKPPFLGCVDVPATAYLSNNPVMEGQN